MKKLKFIRANKTKFGGAEVYLGRLSNELKRLKIEHELVFSPFSKSLPSWLRVFLFNKKVCKEKKDSVYFSLERISCPDIYRAGDGVHKVFLTVEKKSKLNPLHLIYLYLEKKTFQNSKKIIANSHMIKNQIIDTYNIDENKIEVVYNGINLEPFNYQKSYRKLKHEFNLEHFVSEKVFLYVGSGFKRKGVLEFLEILSKLKNKNFRAFIVGKEKKIKYYKNLVKNLGLENRVVFTGPRKDVRDFYTISDIFLFPTRYEPFSNVVLEAMNFKNVVITTKQNGASEILNDDYIMDSPTDYSIVEKIDELMLKDKKIEKIKERNLEIVQDFTIEKNVQRTLEVINEVIN